METWLVADECFRRESQGRRGSEARELEAMMAAQRSGAAEQLGFASFYDYAESVLQLGARETYDRVRVAEALELLPALRQALVTTELCFSAVRELSRVCVPATETVWIDAARGQSVRTVEKRVSGHRPGDLPDDPVDPAEARRNLVYEVTDATQVLAKEVRRRVQAEVGHRLDDDAFMSELLRGYLAAAGTRDARRPSYQIAVTVCERCEQASQDGAGQVVAIDPAALAQAMCDASWIELAHVGEGTKAVSPRTRAAVLARDHHRCRVPGCRSSRWIELHHLVFQRNGGKHDRKTLILLCAGHHRALHQGTLVIHGTTSDTAVFLHPDGNPFGAPRELAASPQA